MGRQLVETIRTHLDLSETQARERAVALLEEVGIPAAGRRIDHYPHQFSGGMRQRVVIALALAAKPRLIIADEPTTALDVSIQAQIIQLLKGLCKEHGTAVMLVTHDMGVIAETADRVAVMYAGRVVEIGPVADVIHRPQHPYTTGLMGSIPSIVDERERLTQIDGAMPRLTAIPPGCPFNPRCPRAFDRCRRERPELLPAGATQAACWLHDTTRERPSHERAGPPQARIAPERVSAEGSPVTRPVQHAAAGEALLELRDVARYFDVSPPWLNRMLERKPRVLLKAVDGVNLTLRRGETVGLVGESGCGKSTVARLIVGLYAPTRGSIRYDGVVLAGEGASAADGAAQRQARRSMQMIFQDPYASLNPRWRVEDIVAEPIRVQEGQVAKADLDARVGALLEQVGLAAADGIKYPHQFSGGQRQRISIARAMAVNPAFLVCDEPTSALDVSVQAQVLNLMRELQQRLGLTYLFISHNLAVVHHIADRVGVMYLGRIVELAPTRTLFAQPQHPYTRMLLDAVPDLSMTGKARVAVAGEVPNPLDPPSGCTFHPRCPLADERCRREVPSLLPAPTGGEAACHAVEERRLPVRVVAAA